MRRVLVEHRFTVLFVTLLLILWATPIHQQLLAAGRSVLASALMAVLMILALAVAIPTTGRTPRTIIAASILGAVAIVAEALELILTGTSVVVAHGLTGATVWVFACVLIMRHVLTRERVVFDTVSASLCAYMLLGVLWATLYATLDRVVPGSIFDPNLAQAGDDPARPRAAAMVDMLYFSFTTLSTLGYGDVVPVSGLARMMAITEAIIGQIFLVVLVARLVSVYSRPAPAGKDAGAAPD